MELRLLLPELMSPQCETLVRPFAGKVVTDIHRLLQCIWKLEQMGESVLVYPDAENYIERKLFEERIVSKVE